MKHAFAVVLLSAALPCAAAVEPMFRGGPSHAGIAASDAPREFRRVKWTFPTGNRVVSSPVMHAGILYFGSDDGSIYAVQAATGRQLWKRATKGPVPSTPAIAGDLLYATSYDGHLYALDLRNGAVRWKFATAGERHFEAKGLHGWTPAKQTFFDPFDVFLSSPVVVNGSVFFGSGDGHLYALDAATGQLRWKFETGDVIHASPAYANDTIYVGSWDSYLYAIDAATGAQKWRFKTGEDPKIHNQVGLQSSPAVVDGVVYVGCRDSNLYAVDAATGEKKWAYNNKGSWVIGSPAVHNGRVYFATSDSAMFHVVDAKTGAEIYSLAFTWPMFSSPAIAGNTLYLGTHEGKLMAIDITTQKPTWTFQTEASKQFGPKYTKADGKPNYEAAFFDFYYDDMIIGVDKMLSVGAILSSPVVVDKTVYFGSADGALYAVE